MVYYQSRRDGTCAGQMRQILYWEFKVCELNDRKTCFLTIGKRYRFSFRPPRLQSSPVDPPHVTVSLQQRYARA